MDWNWASLTRLYKHYLLSYSQQSWEKIPQNPITRPNVWFGAQPVVRQARIQYYSAFWVAATKFGQNGLACRTSLWFSGRFWIQPSVIIFISLLYSWHYSVLIITDIVFSHLTWELMCFVYARFYWAVYKKQHTNWAASIKMVIGMMSRKLMAAGGRWA